MFTLRTQERYNMRHINEKDYVDYTIAGNGWTYTISSFQTALKEFNALEYGILYGNKPDGTRAILDSKQ